MSAENIDINSVSGENTTSLQLSGEADLSVSRKTQTPNRHPVRNTKVSMRNKEKSGNSGGAQNVKTYSQAVKASDARSVGRKAVQPPGKSSPKPKASAEVPKEKEKEKQKQKQKEQRKEKEEEVPKVVYPVARVVKSPLGRWQIEIPEHVKVCKAWIPRVHTWESTVVDLWTQAVNAYACLDPVPGGGIFIPKIDYDTSRGMFERELAALVNKASNCNIRIKVSSKFFIWDPAVQLSLRDGFDALTLRDLGICDRHAVPPKLDGSALIQTCRPEEFLDVPADVVADALRSAAPGGELDESRISPYIFQLCQKAWGNDRPVARMENGFKTRARAAVEEHLFYGRMNVMDRKRFQPIIENTLNFYLRWRYYLDAKSYQGGEGFVFWQRYNFPSTIQLAVEGARACWSAFYNIITPSWLSACWEAFVEWCGQAVEILCDAADFLEVHLFGDATLVVYDTEDDCVSHKIEEGDETVFSSAIHVVDQIEPYNESEKTSLALVEAGFASGRADTWLLEDSVKLEEMLEQSRGAERSMYYSHWLTLPTYRPKRQHLLEGMFLRLMTSPPKHDSMLFSRMLDTRNQSFKILTKMLKDKIPQDGTLALSLTDMGGLEYYNEFIRPGREARKVKRDLMCLEMLKSVWRNGYCDTSDTVKSVFGMIDETENWDDVGRFENPDLFVKTDEVLGVTVADQDDSGFYNLVKAKPRIITNVAVSTYVHTAVPVHAVYSAIKGVTYNTFRVGEADWELVLLSGSPDFETLRKFITTAYDANDQTLFLADAGDDNWTFLCYKGTFIVIENDYSMFDQSERIAAVNLEMLRFLQALGMDLKCLARLFSNFGGNFGTVVRILIKMFLGSGNPMTTLWNTNLNHHKMLTTMIHVIERIMYAPVDEWVEIIYKCIADTDAAFGLRSKPKVFVSSSFCEAALGTTFLKGWFLPDTIGGWFWSPLPSRICKMWKSSCYLGPRKFCKRNQEVANSYMLMTTDPIFTQNLREYVDTVPAHWRTDETLPDTYWEYRISRKDRESPLPCAELSTWRLLYESRYGENIVEALCQLDFRYTRNARIISNPALVRLWEVDYC